ncbi:hypothetical protein ACWV95_22310 [Streptomyces albus]
MRTSARISGAVAAAAAIALLVGGCGSGDDGDGKNAKDKPAAGGEKPAESSPDKGGKAGGAEGKAGLPGVWSTKADGQTLTLTVVGDAASLLRSTEKKVCTGAVMTAGADSSLVLKCPAGIGEERATGKVAEVTASSLKVTWNGGESDTYSKVAEAPAKLPKDPGALRDLPGLSDKLDKLDKSGVLDKGAGKPHDTVEDTDKGRKVREYPGN